MAGSVIIQVSNFYVFVVVDVVVVVVVVSGVVGASCVQSHAKLFLQ